jgi:hypothetical protein
MRLAKIKMIPLALMVIGVSACSQSIAEEFPPQNDFCEERGRALSDEEKISAALRYSYDSEGLQHFQRFKKIWATETGASSPEQIITGYINAHPSCCAVLEPAYIRENWAWIVVDERQRSGSLQNWNSDVQIARISSKFGQFGEIGDEIPEQQGSYLSYPVELRVSACGKIQKIDRG